MRLLGKLAQGLSLSLVASIMVACSDKFPVVFLIEGSKDDSPKMIQKHNGYIFSKAGVIGTDDIESYTTFQDFKTNTYGAAFFLKPGAKNRYYAFTENNMGKHVLPIAGGRPCEIFKIGGPIRDGVICIYSGLTKDDIKKIEDNFEPHEREKKKKEFNDARNKKKIEELKQ